MGQKQAAKKQTAPGSRQNRFAQEYKDQLARKAIAIGKGGQAQVARETGITEASISVWTLDYKKRHGAASSRDTLVSSRRSAPTSSNGSPTAPQLPPFLQGLEEYIAQIVDARVEETVKRILRTTSLMELMKQ